MNLRSLAFIGALFGASSFTNDANACSKAEAIQVFQELQALNPDHSFELEYVTGMVHYLGFKAGMGLKYGKTRDAGRKCSITSNGRRHQRIFHDR
jgi:hypothetical protein